jgi:protein-S-isoprenylcysteine O-methyltransferase Ste14
VKDRGGARVTARLVELALLLAVPLVLHFAIPIAVPIPFPYTYLGIPVMLAGPLLSIAASRAFRAAGASVQLHGGTPRLVPDGPFRYSRNPMYLGMLLWISGLAILLGTLSPFLFVLLVFMLLNIAVVPIEERSLRQLHPAEYPVYEGRVRRWL